MRWFLLLCLVGCGGPQRVAPPPADVIILQLNDVYEINPVGGEGGLARVATLRARLKAEAPVITVLAGDFLSPSALGLAKVDGARLYGAQMIATLDALGLDYATLGNHEFDVGEEALRARINESKFAWISGNVSLADGAPLPKVERRATRTVQTRGGPLTVGLLSVTVNSNPADWVRYDADYLAVTEREAKALADAGADVVVALTHLDLVDDMRLAAEVRRLDLVLGGHEHENVSVRRGPDFTPVHKADANARTVFVHRIRRVDGALDIRSELVRVTAAIPDDPAVAAVAKTWTDRALQSFRDEGLDLEREITVATEDLDGREATVRNGPGALTTLIAEGMRASSPGARIALYNAGSIRIDDVIAAGAPVTEYDVLRILPFGGQVVGVTLTGAVLSQVLAAGEKNRGKGGFLQTVGIGGTPDAPTVDGAAIDPAARYRVAVNDFLLSGHEDNLGFLKEDADGVSEVAPGADLRQSLIHRLGQTPGG